MQICLSLLRRSAGNPRELRNPFPLVFPFPGRTGGEKGTDLSPGCTGPICALGCLPFADTRGGWKDPREAASTPSAQGLAPGAGVLRVVPGFRRSNPHLPSDCVVASLPENEPLCGAWGVRVQAHARGSGHSPAFRFSKGGSSPGPATHVVLRSLRYQASPGEDLRRMFR